MSKKFIIVMPEHRLNIVWFNQFIIFNSKYNINILFITKFKITKNLNKETSQYIYILKKFCCKFEWKFQNSIFQEKNK